ncbi:transcription initiation factor TFIID subunit 3-like isoform X2 [Macrosteles quadrilineatus]|uniref:transcription initiation factor TFIID subunit 3-like isoform X2 n=1 Tax=Macrosteles quadrilineatus TaxID=74068 RepID=UPI0023E0F80F|nr:transcription initiation factor TFIID subunit 3-like isoform X2 [Macrosteles quadrilineatus]
MANTYSRDILKVVVAQICQTIGWHTICTTPLDVLTDVLRRFIHELGTSAHRYGEQFGHTSPTVTDVTLAFKDLGINISELEEYVEYVASVPCAVSVPKFPLERESHLNLLKPGSREVVTRPVHIHEHLPAMHPQLEEEEYLKQLPLSVDISGAESGTSPLSSPKNSIFKRPGDPVSIENNLLKRARMMLEEEGRPLREISSVMMTTSGFLSPAREGKLPEARTPTQSSDSRSSSPQPLSYPTVPPEVKGEKKVKKYANKPAAEGIRKMAEKEMSQKLPEFSTSAQAAEDDDTNVKKLVSMKEMYKLKALKPKMHSPNNSVSSTSGNKNKSNKHKGAGGISAAISSLPKIPKIGQNKNKCDKTSANSQSNKSSTSEKSKEVCVIEGKLSSEPDKQKLNIFKKISKVKEDKVEVDSTKNSESPSSTVVETDTKQRDVRWAQISETIEAVIQKSREQPAPSPEVDVESSDSELFPYDDDLSPPGTPSTPRTPDLIPPQKKSEKHMDSKKKKKGKRDKDKRDSSYCRSPSPKRFKSESTESDYSFLDKPKTPEVESSREEPAVCMLPRNREDIMTNHVFPFFPYAPQPGLIPTPINPSIFNRLNMPLGKQPGLIPHPAMPNLPLPPPLITHANKHEDKEPPVKSKKQSSLSPAPHSSPSSPVTVSTITASDTTDSPPAVTSTTSTPKEKDKKKEHKKEKKEKIKKKKDKKDKVKNKEKGEKKKIKSGKKIKDKEKIKEKKEKKEKKKDKEREEKEKVVETTTAVPKLTLKLGPASPPSNSDAGTTHRKIVIKPVVEPKVEEKRSPSPELARISALVTRPSPANRQRRQPSMDMPGLRRTG